MSVVLNSDEIVGSFIDLHFPISAQSLGFAYDTLLGWFAPGVPEAMADRTAPLGKVMEDVLDEIDSGHRGAKVVIPLTAGLDSRGILGAALRVFDRRRIMCFTVGEPHNAEVVGAREVCRRHNLRHAIVDPNAYAWEPAAMVTYAFESFQRYASFCSVENPMFASCQDQLRQAVGDDYYMLSGFLGDIGSGSHLPPPGTADSDDSAVDHFFRFNRTRRDFIASDRLRASIADFGRSVLAEIQARGYEQVTLYDVLDLGLRQGLRLRGGLHMGGRMYAPHADPRMVAWWYGGIPRERDGQECYRRELGARYADVFCLKDDKLRRAPVSRSPQLTLLGRVVRRVRSRLQPSTERGDLRRNPAKRRLFTEFAESFSARGLVDADLSAVLKSFARQPMGPGLRFVKAVATAEMHIRAGNLDGMLPTPLVLPTPQVVPTRRGGPRPVHA